MQATLRAIRAHKNMSIDDAAKKIGIPTSRLRAIEQHKTLPRIPLIRKMIKDIKSDKYVFISVPLLYEAEMENLFDYAVFVSADKKIRLKRLMQRNSFTQKEAELRIHAQADENEKLKKADFVISNNGSKEELENCVENMLLQLVQ